MRPLFIVGLSAALLLVPCTASAKVASAFGIVVQRCVVLENKDHTQTTGVNVVYYNSHETPATEVDFLIQYHGKSYTLTDRGSFTHNAQINHSLTGTLAGLVWQGQGPELCIPGRVLFATGKVLQ
jgi:hypothetical protein